MVDPLSRVITTQDATKLRNVDDSEYVDRTSQKDEARVQALQARQLIFHFRGKSGVKHEVGIQDRRLARIVWQCENLPGQELF